MNNVAAKTSEKPEPGPGSIWGSECGDLFILARLESTGCESKYAAVSLFDGNRWNDPALSIERATDGLKLRFHSANISVEGVN